MEKRKPVSRICINCNKNFDSISRGTDVRFCSRKCVAEYNGKPIVEAWLKESITGTFTGKYSDALRIPIKKFILKSANYTCEICGNNMWNNKPIPLQIHHKDGDAYNNRPENLQVVCWNCHAQTETFGSKNKSSRASRYH